MQMHFREDLGVALIGAGGLNRTNMVLYFGPEGFTQAEIGKLFPSNAWVPTRLLLGKV